MSTNTEYSDNLEKIFDEIIHGRSLEEITKETNIPLNVLVTIRIRVEHVFRMPNMKESDLNSVKAGAIIQFPKYFTDEKKTNP